MDEFSSRRSYARVIFSEVLRTSSLLGDLTHEFSARLASTLWLRDVIQ